MSNLLPAPVDSEPSALLNSDPKRAITVGIAIVVVFFGGFGAWASLAQLDSAAIAPGVISVDTNRKTVQHLEGGIVKEILVKDGDKVEAGQILMRLDPTRSQAAVGVLEGQFYADLAMEARLLAERDDRKGLSFADELIEATGDPEVVNIIAGQEGMFVLRRGTLDGQVEVLDQQIAQINNEIAGLSAQRKSKSRQLALVQEEYKAVKELFDKGYERKPRLLALQRAAATLEGEQAQFGSEIARAEQRIGEARIRILNLRKTFKEEVSKELREVQARLGEVRDRLTAQQDVLQRIEIVAPLDGIVVGLRHHTLGGVVNPGAAILDIVPTDDILVVEAKLRPDDIDSVHIGLSAQVRLIAYRQRTTPYVGGKLVRVSADLLVDEATGIPYFEARVEIDRDQLASLTDVTLYPGMPVEVLIETGNRTAMDYLLSPITGGFHKAFREQ